MITLYYPQDFSENRLNKHKFPHGRSYGDFSCALALGFFDGVHLAHRELIAATAREAKELGLPLAIFTFASENEGLKSSSPRLFTTDEKLSVLESLSVDVCFVADFSSVKDLSGEEFINEIIIHKLHARSVCCGYNFRFGKGASADATFLKNRLSEAGRRCIVFPEYNYDGLPLSSSFIRGLISKGDMQGAANALGTPYFIEGQVSHGDGRGTGLGIPTVNLALGHKARLLRRGVYASGVYIDGKLFPGVTNIGECPTFAAREVHAETNILGFSDNLYGKQIRVYLLDFLRDERVFYSEKELTEQINYDKDLSERIYKETKWQELGLN